MRHRRACFASALLSLCVAVLAPCTHAAPPAPIDAPALIDALPQDAELIVVADDLAKNLRTPAGGALAQALGESGFFRPTFQRWSELAQQLDMDPVEAIDELLGQRVVLVARDVTFSTIAGDPRQGAWAVMTWIPPETERRVRKGLKLAPRQKIDAQPVLAAEQGEFSLIMLQTQDAAGQRQTVLLLAPAADDSLIKPMIGALREARAQSDLPLIPGRRDGRPHNPDADLHLRLALDADGALELAARPTDRGWTADLLIEKPGDARRELGERHVSEATFNSLTPRSMVLLSESVPDRAQGAGDPGLMLNSLFTEVPERFQRILGGRTLFMIERQDESHRGLRLVLASEASYPGDPVAEGDRAITSLLSPGAGSAPPEGAIEGQYPRAVRTDTIPAQSTSIFGERIHAAWAYSPERRVGRRWWALSLSGQQRPTPGFRAFVDALPSDERAPEGGRNVALGLIRPRELVESLSRTPWVALSPITAASHVQRVTWSLRLLDPDEPAPSRTRIAGRVEIEMRLDPDHAQGR